jgi:hypothetical protein
MTEYTEYEKLLFDLLYYFNPCRKAQLVRALHRNFKDMKVAEAEKILLNYQSKGHVLLSSDGWAMTKGKYVEYTGDDKFELLTYESDTRIGNMNRFCATKETKKMVDVLWVLVDMLPDSRDFSVFAKPFQVNLVYKGKLFQVIDIPADEEDLRVATLQAMPNDFFEDFKKNIYRIAIMENPAHAWKVPEGIGFRYVVTIDENEKAHYRIVETRKKKWELDEPVSTAETAQ